MKTLTTKIVLPPTPPDLDGVACAIAYTELLNTIGVRALAWFSGQPDAEARYVLSQCKGLALAEHQAVVEANEYILVDGSELEALPQEVDPKKVIEVIDHRLHRSARTAYPNAKLAIEPVGAAATLIAERFRKHEVVPSSEAGMLLYGAIHSNTQCLRGSVTSHRDIGASKWLEDVASIPDGLLDGQFAARKEEILADLPAAIVRESKRYHHETGSYIISQLEFSGAGQLIKSKLADLTDYSQRLGPRTMLNLVDIATGKSYLLVPDGDLRLKVSELTGLNFKELIAESDAVVLRKQILAGMEGIPWHS